MGVYVVGLQIPKRVFVEISARSAITKITLPSLILFDCSISCILHNLMVAGVWGRVEPPQTGTCLWTLGFICHTRRPKERPALMRILTWKVFQMIFFFFIILVGAKSTVNNDPSRPSPPKTPLIINFMDQTELNVEMSQSKSVAKLTGQRNDVATAGFRLLYHGHYSNTHLV